MKERSHYLKLTFGKPSTALCLQTPSRDDALALLLSFGSANTWFGESPSDSYPRAVPDTYG